MNHAQVHPNPQLCCALGGIQAAVAPSATGTVNTVLPNARFPADLTLSDAPRRSSSFLRLIATHQHGLQGTEFQRRLLMPEMRNGEPDSGSPFA
jgi:hypothetical protein